MGNLVTEHGLAIKFDGSSVRLTNHFLGVPDVVHERAAWAQNGDISSLSVGEGVSGPHREIFGCPKAARASPVAVTVISI